MAARPALRRTRLGPAALAAIALCVLLPYLALVQVATSGSEADSASRGERTLEVQPQAAAEDKSWKKAEYTRQVESEAPLHEPESILNAVVRASPPLLKPVETPGPRWHPGAPRVFPYDHLTVQNVSLEHLRLCRTRYRKLSCVGNPTCLGPSCPHYKDDTFMGNFSFAPHQRVISKFFETRHERRVEIATFLEELQAQSKYAFNGTIMVISFNNGYGYLFANWYCSLLAAKVDLARIQSHTIVVGTDKGARALAASLGFFTVDPERLFAWTGRRIIEEAAPGFARGSHALINLVVKYGLVGDLINMGIDVVMMDTDFIWTGEASEFMLTECRRGECDGIFIKDGRPFLPAVVLLHDSPEEQRDDPVFVVPENIKHPYPQFNTGFFLLRSSPLVNVFMTTLMMAGFLQQWKGTDQLIFNSLVYHHDMPRLKFQQLFERRFVPGGTLHVGKVLTPFPRPPELLAVHPSDADWHTKKIPKLGKLGLWFLAEKCPSGLDACDSIEGCMPMSRAEMIKTVNSVDINFFSS